MVDGAIRAGRRVVGESRADPKTETKFEREKDLPLTTSFTHAASAKISRLYSGRLRGSMVASRVRKGEACAEERVMRGAACWGDRVATRRSRAVAVGGAGVAVAVSWR
jgi:hypothetical protein